MFILKYLNQLLVRIQSELKNTNRERVVEIAQMLSGTVISDSALHR
jgi:DNA repair ATPase RecN